MSDFSRHIPTNCISITQDNGDVMRGLANHFDLRFSNFKSADNQVQSKTSSDHLLELPESIGSGWMRHMVLRPGLEIIALDFSLKQPTLTKGLQSPTLIELGFWQDGRDVRFRFTFGEGVTQPNQAALSTIPESYESEFLYPHDERIRGVRLSIEPSVFQSWLSDMQLPENLKQGLFEQPSEMIAYQQPIPTALALPLRQLQNTQWHGFMH